jgi:hypothetical protein
MRHRIYEMARDNEVTPDELVERALELFHDDNVEA